MSVRSVTKLTQDNTAGFYKLASLHYQLGESEESLAEIRECLKLDPEHKDCYPLYKKLKKVVNICYFSKLGEYVSLEYRKKCQSTNINFVIYLKS